MPAPDPPAFQLVPNQAGQAKKQRLDKRPGHQVAGESSGSSGNRAIAMDRSRALGPLPAPQMVVSAVRGIEIHHNSFDSLYEDLFGDNVALDEPHPDGSCKGELKRDYVPPPLVGCSSLEENMEVPIGFPVSLMTEDMKEGNAGHCIMYNGKNDVFGKESMAVKKTAKALADDAPSVMASLGDGRSIGAGKRQASAQASTALPTQGRSDRRKANKGWTTHLAELDRDIDCPWFGYPVGDAS